MKRILLFASFIISATFCLSQDYSITFTSVSDAKFYIYLNGELQNEHPSGMVTLKHLDNKDYHLRLVVDDPFEISLTRTIRPSSKCPEYLVVFNAVKERVYIKPAKKEQETAIWQEDDDSETSPATSPEPAAPRKRTTIRRDNIGDTATQQIMKRIRTQTLEE